MFRVFQSSHQFGKSEVVKSWAERMTERLSPHTRLSEFESVEKHINAFREIERGIWLDNIRRRSERRNRK